MKQIKFILFAITFFSLKTSIAYACPGCSQAIAESGGTNGLIAIYSLLAGMPFLIIGSIIVGVVYSNRKVNESNESNLDSDLLQNGGNKN